MVPRAWMATAAGAIVALLTTGLVAAVADGRRDGVKAPAGVRSAALPGRVPLGGEGTTTTSSAISLPVAPTTRSSTTAGSPIIPPTTQGATPSTVIPPTPSTTVVGPTSTTVAPRPSTWQETSNGVSITLRVDPASPRVGDVVHLYYGATSTVEWCCMYLVYVNNAAVLRPSPVPSGCPGVHGSEELTYVASQPGALDLRIEATRGKICTLPPATLTSATLSATVDVAPAG